MPQDRVRFAHPAWEIQEYAMDVVEDGACRVVMPVGAEIVAVAVAPLRCWALVDPAARRETRHLRWVRSGDAVPVGSRHRGSALVPQPREIGGDMWHLVELP